MTPTQLARILRAGEQTITPDTAHVTNQTFAAALRAMRHAATEEADRERVEESNAPTHGPVTRCAACGHIALHDEDGCRYTATGMDVSLLRAFGGKAFPVRPGDRCRCPGEAVG